MIVIVLTIVTLNLLDRLAMTPLIIVTQVILSRLVIVFCIMAFMPAMSVLMYSFCSLYLYLEKRSSHYRLAQYNQKNGDDFRCDPDFDAARTNLYTQVALVFVAKYNNPYVLRSLNDNLRQLLLLQVMAQLLRTQTMAQLAAETHESWDLSRVEGILYDRHFRLISGYLGLHVQLAFCILAMIVEQQSNPIYQLLVERYKQR